MIYDQLIHDDIVMWLVVPIMPADDGEVSYMTSCYY